jgi:hypothetical protein
MGEKPHSAPIKAQTDMFSRARGETYSELRFAPGAMHWQELYRLAVLPR